jgi:hypothetical protein
VPISGPEFERGRTKDSFEVGVEEALKSIYPGGLSVAEIHERFVGRFTDPSPYDQVVKANIRGMNRAALELTDLRMETLRLSNAGLESRYLSGPGKSTLKCWRWKRA